jgi:hypothetical protein
MTARAKALPAALCSGALLLAVLSAAGCSSTCDYGSSGSNGSNCKSRPEPNAREKDGFTGASLTPRFALMRLSRETRGGVDAVTVNRWGEIGVRRDGDWVWTANVDGKPVSKKGLLSGFGEGTDPFDAKDADPEAVEAAMDAVREREPTAEFIAAVLGLANPRIPGGADVTRSELRWRITTKIGKDYAYYETDRRGKPACVIVSTDTTGACRPV